MRVLRRSSIPVCVRAGVPKKAWLKFSLRLYGWGLSARANSFAIFSRLGSGFELIPGTFVRRGFATPKVYKLRRLQQSGELQMALKTLKL